MCALTASNSLKVPHADAVFQRTTWDTNGGVVLLPAIQTVRKNIVDNHPVELRGGLIGLRRPTPPFIERHIRPTIISLHHPFIVRGIDPEVVIIAVRCRDGFKRHATIDRLHHGSRQDIDRHFILRVGKNVRVVPATIANTRIVIDMLPGLTCVIGTENAAIDRLDHRPYPIRIGSRDTDAGISHQRWQALLQLLPAVATVGGLVQATAGTATAYIPGFPAVIPHGRINHTRIAGVHAQEADAGIRIDKQHSLPIGATVDRSIDTALLGRGPGTSLRTDINNIRILRIHNDLRYLPRLIQAKVNPGAARIAGLIYAVAVRSGYTTNGRLTRADINNIRI